MGTDLTVVRFCRHTSIRRMPRLHLVTCLSYHLQFNLAEIPSARYIGSSLHWRCVLYVIGKTLGTSVYSNHNTKYAAEIEATSDSTSYSELQIRARGRLGEDPATSAERTPRERWYSRCLPSCFLGIYNVHLPSSLLVDTVI